jgi:hypothetical protein
VTALIALAKKSVMMAELNKFQFFLFEFCRSLFNSKIIPNFAVWLDMAQFDYLSIFRT